MFVRHTTLVRLGSSLLIAALSSVLGLPAHAAMIGAGPGSGSVHSSV